MKKSHKLPIQRKCIHCGMVIKPKKRLLNKRFCTLGHYQQWRKYNPKVSNFLQDLLKKDLYMNKYMIRSVK